MTTDIDGWTRLAHELEAWHATGQDATLWWRDDDAGPVSDPLAYLLATAEVYSVPLTLAVVPQRIVPELSRWLERQRSPHTTPVQHGFAHTNHAPAGEKKAEFGAHRPLPVMASEVAAGWARIAQLPGAEPLFVPPWNRWTPALAPALPVAGLRAVSTYGPRRAAAAAPGLIQVNTHADPIAWRTTRAFVGDEPMLDAITAHLVARRMGLNDRDEPTGILTHHLDHDEASWLFLERLFSWTAQRPVRWLSVAEMERSLGRVLTPRTVSGTSGA
jgi:hypothetical protein